MDLYSSSQTYCVYTSQRKKKKEAKAHLHERLQGQLYIILKILRIYVWT
jgi:hypothetical protein